MAECLGLSTACKPTVRANKVSARYKGFMGKEKIAEEKGGRNKKRK